MLIAAVCTPLATALLAMLWDWRLGLALLFSFPLIVPIQQCTQPFTERERARLAGANARLNAELLEYSQGLPVLKAANSTSSRLPHLQQAVGEVETIQREALLAEALPDVGRAQMLADMTAWGYNYREGSVYAWLDGDAIDAIRWLQEHHLIDAARQRITQP